MINFKDFQKNLHENVEYVTEEELNEMPAPTHIVPSDVKHKIGDTVTGTQSYGRGQSRTLTGVVTAMGRKHTYVQPTQQSAKDAGVSRAHYKILHKDVVKEELTGNQKKLDVDKDGKIEKSDLKKLRKEETVEEEKMTDAEMSKREKIVKGMKKSYKDFVAKYGSRAKDVMYATATKRAMGEETEIDEELDEAKKDDYWDFKDLKDKDKHQPTSRKVSGTRYGGSAQKDEPEDDDEDDKPKAQPAKRGRGRPKGSNSGARQQGSSGKKSYGGLSFHSLNLPNSNK